MKGTVRDLENVEIAAMAGELHVHQPRDAEAQGEPLRHDAHFVELAGGGMMRRQHRGRVPGVNARLLDVLENAADHRLFTVGDQIEIELGGVLEVAIEEHRVPVRDLRSLGHEMRQRLFVVADRHGPSAEHVGRADEHRKAEPSRYFERLREGPRGAVFGLPDAFFGK